MAHTGIQATATGDVTTGPTTVQAISAGGTAGTCVLRDGGAGGTIRATFGVTAGMSLPIPGGMRFPNGLHATLTSADDVTFWLGDA